MLLKHNMLAKILTSLLLYHSFTFPFYCQLQSVQLDSKLNGIIVKLELDSLPDYKNISGWQSDNDWFYLTLYQCKSPLNGSILKSVHEDIIEFETRLSDVLNKSVNKFEGTLEETCNKYVDMLESICK